MKLTVAQRQQVREWIKLCRVKGLSVEETRQFVNQRLQPEDALTHKGISAYITQIRSESRNWIDKMAFDVYEFVSELQERWDHLKALSRIEWEMLDKARKEGNDDMQIKSVVMLCKLHDQLLQMITLLPQIAIPAKSPTLSFNNNNDSLQGPKPIVDGNGNGNAKNNQPNSFIEPDFPTDQP